MFRSVPTLLCNILAMVIASNETETKSVSSKTEVLKRLVESHNYDSNIVPDFELNVPTNITVQLVIQNIHSISESTMDFSVEMYLRQSWVDRRLAYDNLNLSSSAMLEMDYRMMSKIWTPDTFFPNEKEAYVHDVTALNKLMHLYNDGTIVHSTRLSLQLTCSMKLHKYPFDTHRCPIYIESYAFTKSNIRYVWNPQMAVHIANTSEMPRFEPDKNIGLGSCDKDYEETGNFSCISAEIVFRRKIGYYIVQVYIPSVLIVALSWVSFWVDFDAVPARVSLGIMTVLTMTTQSSGARESLPHVSYIKAIDVWMSMCLLFVFAALLEYAYVNVTSRRKKDPVPPITNGVATEEIDSGTGFKENTQSQRTDVKIAPPGPSAALVYNSMMARRVDKISRVAFPLLYLIFNIVFWAYYIMVPDP